MNNKKIHVEEMRIAKYFISICDKNNYKYFLLGGTFLGAIRHKGFIPWDDDMDFGMPRSDYENLINYLKKNPSSKYQLCTFQDGNNSDYPIKIESTNVKLVDLSIGIEKNRNVWIDIFPLDGMPKNQIKLNFHKIKLLGLRAGFKLSQLSKNVSINNPSRTKSEKVIIKLGKITKIEKILDEKKMYSKIDKTLKKYNYEDSKFIVNFMGAYKFKEMFPKEVYEKTKEYLFEDMLMTAPKDYNYVLTQLYGDYLTPPKDEEKNKHQIFIKE